MMLSYIVPVYNVEKYLRCCVESIAEQKVPESEILLIDDGSTDGSGRLCDELKEAFPDLKVIHQENQGLSVARNTGLRLASGDYILFVDADDRLIPAAAGRLLKYALSWDLDVGVGDFVYVHEGGAVTANEKPPVHFDVPVSGRRFFLESMKTRTALKAVWKSIYRRAFLLGNQLYFHPGHNHEDEEWTPRVYLKAARVKDIGIVFYQYLVRPDGISRDPAAREKNALDIIHNCQRLKLISMDEQGELRRVFQDRIVNLYLSAVYKGKLVGPKYRHQVSGSFFYGMRMERKTFLKAMLFRCSRTLYYMLNHEMKTTNIPRHLKLLIQKSCRRLLILPGMRARLMNHDFSIISSSCNGGVLTSDLGVRFNSPTVNLSMPPGDFLKLVSDLPFWLSCELKEAQDKDTPYPVGLLNGELRIDFIHYKSFQEAKDKWERRKTRVHYENLFFMMTDRDGCTEEQIRKFDALPFANKVIFTSRQYPELKSAVWCSEFAGQDEVPVLTLYRNLRGERLYDRYFDFVQWLNSGMERTEKETEFQHTRQAQRKGG